MTVIKEWPTARLPREAEDALAGCIALFELWRDGLFRKAGIDWVEGSEPPAISTAREVAAKLRMPREK